MTITLTSVAAVFVYDYTNADAAAVGLHDSGVSLELVCDHSNVCMRTKYVYNQISASHDHRSLSHNQYD